MEKITHKELLDAGVHFGHLKRKWNPKMAPYIFMEHKGIHITDLNKTIEKLGEAAQALRQIASTGKKILFVATKKQARAYVEECAKRVNMPYVTERWLGGMLTNFSTIRKSVKKLENHIKLMSDVSFEDITKKERLRISREREKLERALGGIAQLNRLPAALYIVDITKEHIALAEALKLNINTFAIVDTNADPTVIDYPIPANDDAAKSVAIITEYITKAIEIGLNERKAAKEEEDALNEAREAKIKEEGEIVDSKTDKKEEKSETKEKEHKTTKKIILKKKVASSDKPPSDNPKVSDKPKTETAASAKNG
ncbi:MAG: 30S ribosomal protein S2 [Bacteroidetes bacterium]|nr:30S ribosomal protein S2 [Bacteroidota bacterium]